MSLHGHLNGLSFQWRFANGCDFDRFLKLACSLITMSLINRPRQMRLVPLLDTAPAVMNMIRWATWTCARCALSPVMCTVSVIYCSYTERRSVIWERTCSTRRRHTVAAEWEHVSLQVPYSTLLAYLCSSTTTTTAWSESLPASPVSHALKPALTLEATSLLQDHLTLPTGKVDSDYWAHGSVVRSVDTGTVSCEIPQGSRYDLSMLKKFESRPHPDTFDRSRLLCALDQVAFLFRQLV